jgi:hypothetical protein
MRNDQSSYDIKGLGSSKLAARTMIAALSLSKCSLTTLSTSCWLLRGQTASRSRVQINGHSCKTICKRVQRPDRIRKP